MKVIIQVWNLGVCQFGCEIDCYPYDTLRDLKLKWLQIADPFRLNSPGNIDYCLGQTIFINRQNDSPYLGDYRTLAELGIKDGTVTTVICGLR